MKPSLLSNEFSLIARTNPEHDNKDKEETADALYYLRKSSPTSIFNTKQSKHNSLANNFLVWLLPVEGEVGRGVDTLVVGDAVLGTVRNQERMLSVYFANVHVHFLISMVCETKKQSMAWTEHGLQIYDVSMEDKMAVEAFGRARNYGLDGCFDMNQHGGVA